MSTMKTFLKRDWKKMEIASEPTSTNGQIRKDEDGKKWEWVRANKRVDAKFSK